MQIIKSLFVLLLFLVLHLGSTGQTPVLKWSFDSEDTITNNDSVAGTLSFAEGISGKAIIFDGYSTEVVRKTKPSDFAPESFTITAWIAPQEYSWNISAIVNQQKDFKSGFLFGINHLGKLVAGISVDNDWKPWFQPTVFRY